MVCNILLYLLVLIVLWRKINLLAEPHEDPNFERRLDEITAGLEPYIRTQASSTTSMNITHSFQSSRGGKYLLL